MTENRDYFLAEFLGCKYDETEALNTFAMDAKEIFEGASEKTLDGFGKFAYESALSYLKEMYLFAKRKLDANPRLYDGSVLKWDADLLKDAIDFLSPSNDLSWNYDTYEYWMELSNWDLYWSVVQTINEDFDSGLSLKIFDASYFKNVYGGAKTPEKYNSLLI